VLQSADAKSEKAKAFLKKAAELLDEMGRYVKAPSTLKEYSPWMWSFQASQHEEQLELPGYCYNSLFTLVVHPFNEHRVV